MANILRTLYVLPFILLTKLSIAMGMIETPVDTSPYRYPYTHAYYETGIGVISGWHCTANIIQIQIDDQPLLTAGSKTARGDTLGVCGRTDTGFSLLVNYNNFDLIKSHKIIAFADGVEFARVGYFKTINLGAEYLVGKTGTYRLRNFPEVGRETVVNWHEEKQNFSLGANGYATPITGVYYGAVNINRGGGNLELKQGKYTVVHANGRLSINAEYINGSTCSFSAPVFQPLPGSGYVNTGNVIASSYASEHPASPLCPEFGRGFVAAVNGETLTGNWNADFHNGPFYRLKAVKLD